MKVKGFYLFFVFQNKEGNKVIKYLYSADGTSWAEYTFPAEKPFSKLALLEDKGFVRVFLLAQDGKTIYESSFSGRWSEVKERIKLNLKIDDLAVLKYHNTYFLLFTLDSTLYFTQSADLRDFLEPQAVVSLGDTDFFLDSRSLEVISKTTQGVEGRKLTFR